MRGVEGDVDGVPTSQLPPDLNRERETRVIGPEFVRTSGHETALLRSPF